MKKSYALIVFLVGLVTILSVAKAILYNSLSTSGILVGKAEQEINYYKTQNAILSEQILTASALVNILDKAEKSGFTGENPVMVLKTSSSLAVKP